MWLDINESEDVSLKDAAMIVAVSTSLPQYRALYSQARELGKYLLRKMEFGLVATIRSSSFSPEVLVRQDGLSTLPECSIRLNRGRRDILLLSGDMSPIDDQYEFTRFLLEYAKGKGVKEVFSVGARWSEAPLTADAEPQPNGFATDSTGAARLKKHGVKLITEEPAPFFASMVVGLAGEYDIRGYKLSVDHGEPSPHPKSVAQLLGSLSSLIGFEVPLDELRASKSADGHQREPGDSTIYH